MDATLITILGTAIVAPILSYLKTREERLKTADKRDAQQMVIEKRLADLESQTHTINEMKKAIDTLNITMTKIQTILEIYVKNCDSTNCPQIKG
jgi:hypothetical protein